MPDGPVAVAGATGYIGGLLVERLAGDGADVIALARSPQRAERLAGERVEVRRADVSEPDSLPAALEGAHTAYYLVHSMGRGSGGGFAERDRRGAENFARAASSAGVSRIVYLGGLGEGSEHLDSRHETALALAGGDVPVAYFRAAAVIGAGSESFRTVLYLVRRLPVMITPRWVNNRTQPIAVDDVVGYLAEARALGPEVEREIEIGGPDVTTYAGMMDEAARALGKRPPLRLGVPLLTPALSSLWLGLITPVDTGVARPLVEGLSHDTVVSDPSGMELFDLEPMPLPDAMRRALAEDRSA